MIALPTDVARSDHRAKAAFERVFEAMVGALERGLKHDGSRDNTTAMAIAALCVGGMVIARSLDDHALADQLREASQAVALELGGWQEGATPESSYSQQGIGA